MKRLLYFAMLALAGCLGPLSEADRTRPDTPTHDRAAICQALAAQIDAGNLDTTDDLVRVLQLLADQGDWTADDSAAVDAALPDLPTARRALAADDSRRLRGVP